MTFYFACKIFFHKFIYFMIIINFFYHKNYNYNFYDLITNLLFYYKIEIKKFVSSIIILSIFII